MAISRRQSVLAEVEAIIGTAEVPLTGDAILAIDDLTVEVVTEPADYARVGPFLDEGGFIPGTMTMKVSFTTPPCSTTRNLFNSTHCSPLLPSAAPTENWMAATPRPEAAGAYRSTSRPFGTSDVNRNPYCVPGIGTTSSTMMGRLS